MDIKAEKADKLCHFHTEMYEWQKECLHTRVILPPIAYILEQPRNLDLYTLPPLIECDSIPTKHSDVNKSNLYQIERRIMKFSTRETPKKKRGLGFEANLKLNMWFQSNIKHPYPNQTEKEELSKICKLSMTQINTWFGNKRSRLKKRATKKQRECLLESLLNKE